jgi:hypothetical protein
MSESEIVLPLDEGIWNYVKEMEGTIAIPVGEGKAVDLFGALYDIYFASKSSRPEESRKLLIVLTCLLAAAPLGQADKVLKELDKHKLSSKNFTIDQ